MAAVLGERSVVNLKLSLAFCQPDACWHGIQRRPRPRARALRLNQRNRQIDLSRRDRPAALGFNIGLEDCMAAGRHAALL